MKQIDINIERRDLKFGEKVEYLVSRIVLIIVSLLIAAIILKYIPVDSMKFTVINYLNNSASIKISELMIFLFSALMIVYIIQRALLLAWLGLTEIWQLLFGYTQVYIDTDSNRVVISDDMAEAIQRLREVKYEKENTSE